MTQTALLMLADGTCFEGLACGAAAEKSGELVFNTAVCGYQEILTDPAQSGQIVVFTHPHVGNCGVCPADSESGPYPASCRAAGVVCVELSELTGHWRSSLSLGDWLAGQGVPGIAGIDTRLLARHLRETGTQGAVLSSIDKNRESLLAKARAVPKTAGRDQASTAGVKAPTPWTPDADLAKFVVPGTPEPRHVEADLLVSVLDFGVAQSFLHNLADQGLALTLWPAQAKAQDILNSGCRGLVLSDGPGDPNACPGAVRVAQELIGRLPIFGVGFGFQILALALGGAVEPMRYGHHGATQPVRRVADGMFLSTSQHHSFVVNEGSLPSGNVAVTHWNAVDGTVEGITCTTAPAFGVQFAPAAFSGSGVSDAGSLYARFRQLLLSPATSK